MSPLKSAAVFVLAAIQAASAAWIDSKTQALLGLQMVSTPAVATLGTWPDSGLQSRLELAQPRVQTSPSATAVSSNGVVYSATALVDVQQLVTGWDANGTPFACYGNRAFDGSFSISADGTNTPLISDAQLPGGQTLANSGYVEMGCARNAGGVTTVYFMAVDPNHKLSTGQPFLSLWYADSSGNSGQLIGAGSTLTAKDPRTGQDTTYTVTQVSPSLEVRGGKATVLLVATPPQQSTAVPPVPQGLFVQIGTSGQPTVLFNNLKDQNSNFWFSSIAGFLQSEGNLWILGQSVAPPNAPTKTALGLFRVQNGQPTLIKNYFEPVGSVANSWKDGVQVYALDSTGVAKVYSFVPDNALPFGGFGSNGEVVLFSGTRIDDVVLSSRDWQIPTGEKELYVITSGDNSLLKVGSGTARLIHTPQMSPTGTARGVALSANQVLYVQNEG
ncbi:MAG: hypothetical protein KGJ93_05625, partial [Patescibacteria group bacterium]|nr:hypothetical protein [Patescibacteria group bacterium]